MKKGYAPIAPSAQWVGKRNKYELDHVQELQHGGNVYDMSNVQIKGPLIHMKGK